MKQDPLISRIPDQQRADFEGVLSGVASYKGSRPLLSDGDGASRA